MQVIVERSDESGTFVKAKPAQRVLLEVEQNCYGKPQLIISLKGNRVRTNTTVSEYLWSQQMSSATCYWRVVPPYREVFGATSNALLPESARAATTTNSLLVWCVPDQVCIPLEAPIAMHFARMAEGLMSLRFPRVPLGRPGSNSVGSVLVLLSEASPDDLVVLRDHINRLLVRAPGIRPSRPLQPHNSNSLDRHVWPQTTEHLWVLR